MSHPKDGAVDDTKEGEDVDDNGLAAGLASADSFRKFLTSYRRVRKLPEASDDGAVAAHLERAQNSYSFADENGPSRRPTAAATAAEAATRYSNMRRSPRHRRALDYYLRDTTGNRGGQRAKQPHGRSIPTGSGGGDRNALGDLRNRAAARSASVGPFMPWTDPSESFSSALARLDKLHVPETLAHVLIELDRMGHWGVYTIQRCDFLSRTPLVVVVVVVARARDSVEVFRLSPPRHRRCRRRLPYGCFARGAASPGGLLRWLAGHLP